MGLRGEGHSARQTPGRTHILAVSSGCKIFAPAALSQKFCYNHSAGDSTMPERVSKAGGLRSDQPRSSIQA